jgi:hypothetical protein
MANAWLLKPHPITSATASSVSIGAASNVALDYAGVVWASGSGTSHALLIDLGADRALDTVMLFGVVAPAGTTFIAQGATSAQGSGFASGGYPDTPSASIFAGSIRLTGGTGVTLATPTGWPPVRYVRFVFTLPTAGVVQASRAVIGSRILLERNFSFGAAFGVRDLGSFDFSRRGVPLRTRGAKLRTLGLSFSSIRKDEVEASTKPLLEQVGNTEMIALITDPAVDAQRENRCYFGPLVGDLSHTWRNAAAFEAKVNIVSIF